jgi:hypothetical protein
MIRNSLLATAAVALTLGATGAANAAQYVTQLEWDANGLHVPSYGTVTVTDHAADVDHAAAYVNVQVAFTSGFADAVDSIVDTGEGHMAFVFNLDPAGSGSTIEFVPTPSDFSYAGEIVGKGKDCTAPFGIKESPFGCFRNGISLSGKGASDPTHPTLEFNVLNDSGISFLGGANHFTSNVSGGSVEDPDGNVLVGGWWFGVDTFGDGRASGGQTYAIAGRDYCTIGLDCGGGAIPEPGTWGLMIAGFGGAGAMLRRRRTPRRIAA